MSKSKTGNIVRTNKGSVEYILNNKIKGMFYYDDEGKYCVIKNGKILEKTYESLEDLRSNICS